MAQVKLAEHQGADEEGTATERYGPKGGCETLLKTLSREALLSLPHTCLKPYEDDDILFLFLEISHQILL